MAIVCEPVQVNTTDGVKSFFGLSTVSTADVPGSFDTYATQRGYTAGILDLTDDIHSMQTGDERIVLTLTNGCYVKLIKVSTTPFSVKIYFYDSDNHNLNRLSIWHEDDVYVTIRKYLYGFCKDNATNHIGTIEVINADQYNGTKTNYFFGSTAEAQAEKDAQYQTFMAEISSVKIKWTDPSDIATNEPCPATWAGTVVVRKEGSAPKHRWDGTLITDSTTRDQYSINALEDNTVDADKTYYYGIFPYDTNGYYRFTKVVSVSTILN